MISDLLFLFHTKRKSSKKRPARRQVVGVVSRLQLPLSVKKSEMEIVFPFRFFVFCKGGW